jgi:DNA-binding NtrC family response regulator
MSQLILKDLGSKLLYPLNKPILNFGSSEAAHIKIVALPELAFQLRLENDNIHFTNLSGEIFKVNDKKVNTLKLKIGDQISLGDSQWELIDASVKLNSLKEDAPINFDFFKNLLKTLSGLLNKNNLDEIPLEILTLACQIMKADHGLLRFDKKEVYFPREKFTVSRKAVSLAQEADQAFLWNLNDDSSLDINHSIAQNQLTSILIFPINTDQWFYLQRQAGEVPFNNNDKELFEAFGKFFQSFIQNYNERDDQKNEISRLKDIQKKGSLIFQAKSMVDVVNTAEKAAKKPIPILIKGETGTGKEQMAQFIHQHSDRAEGPFIAVNCGAIPSNLIESVLFGHKKGAFTGAIENQIGLFQKAHEGTLFLDEIGELDQQLQVRLLRVLQEKKIHPLGADKEIEIDVRILSATHVDLEEAMKNKSFREDLFFRLNVLSIEVPPLRDRIQDALILADHFVEKYSTTYNRSAPKISKDSQKQILLQRWSGNVRELENRIQKALVLCDDIIEPRHLGFGSDDTDASIFDLKSAKELAESNTIKKALQESNGNLTLASKMLNIDRKVLREHMERLHILKEDYKN